jgi:hypothetical protein
VATEWLKRQPPDGYTVMVTETGAAAAAPAALVGGTRYDPVADFTHLGVISTPPGLLVVTERFPAATPADVLARMRTAAPDSITYASSGFGGVLHLRAEMLAQALGNRFVHVPYRSGAQMLQAILTGEAQFGIAALASATPLVREGKVRGVAMVGSRRFPLYPDIPTLEELGIQGFDDGGFFLLIAPAGLPRPVAAALNRALVASLTAPTSGTSCCSPATTRCRGRTRPTTPAPSWRGNWRFTRRSCSGRACGCSPDRRARRAGRTFRTGSMLPAPVPDRPSEPRLGSGACRTRSRYIPPWMAA